MTSGAFSRQRITSGSAIEIARSRVCSNRPASRPVIRAPGLIIGRVPRSGLGLNRSACRLIHPALVLEWVGGEAPRQLARENAQELLAELGSVASARFDRHRPAGAGVLAGVFFFPNGAILRPVHI